jgi:hypothetical protein
MRRASRRRRVFVVKIAAPADPLANALSLVAGDGSIEITFSDQNTAITFHHEKREVAM